MSNTSGSRPDLTALDLLVRVAESGSLGAAARGLSMAQPNASRSLSRLERQLGVTLLVRTPGGSRLTAEGEVVVAWARDALVAVDRVVDGARSLAAARSGHLTVAASLTIAEYLAPRWLARFQRRAPDQHVSLDVGNSVEVLHLVESGVVPLGFIESPHMPTTVVSTEVGHDSLVVVVAPDHPWAGSLLPPTALVAGELALREAGSGTRETLVSALARRGLELGEARLELASTAAVKAAAVAGGPAAVLSELAVADELRTGQLVRVEVADLDLSRALHAVWLPTRWPTGPTAELIRIARE